MIRKQVYLTDNLDQDIRLLAKKELRAEAEVIRELLNIGLAKKSPNKAPAEVLLKIAGKGKKGPKDLSVNIRSYLYGPKSTKYGKKTSNRR